MALIAGSLSQCMNSVPSKGNYSTLSNEFTAKGIKDADNPILGWCGMAFFLKITNGSLKLFRLHPIREHHFFWLPRSSYPFISTLPRLNRSL